MPHRYIVGLLERPDLRNCPAVVRFLEFESELSIVVPPLRLRVTGHSDALMRFSVSDFSFYAASGILVVTHYDNTPLSRLGKAWSMVEPEEIGGFAIYHVEVFNVGLFVYMFVVERLFVSVHLVKVVVKVCVYTYMSVLNLRPCLWTDHGRRVQSLHHRGICLPVLSAV